MNRWLYQLLLAVVFPLFLYSAWKRCRKSAQSLEPIPHCFKSRWGLNPTPFKKGGIWIHAVSVGETRSTFPLLQTLKAQYPNLPITLTSGSTQGAIQARSFAPVEVQHQMIPYDYPWAVKRFLQQLQPKLVLIIETEIWPNLYQACNELNIPLILANARLKENSFYAYQKWGGSLIPKTLNQTTLIGAQFPIDAKRFIELGTAPSKVKILGNLKFDITLPDNLEDDTKTWREQNAPNRFIWVAASTHAATSADEQDEEQQLLQAHQQLLKTQPNALLILVPRHADRFKAVAQQCQLSGLNTAIRSQNQPIHPETQVYLADTVGELMLWFAASDAAFIGGSLVNFGGHNILEPAALNKPILSGPHYQNLQALYETFIQQDALLMVNNAADLAKTLDQIAQNPTFAQTAAEKSHQTFQSQTGTLPKLIQIIEPYLLKSGTKKAPCTKSQIG